MSYLLLKRDIKEYDRGDVVIAYYDAGTPFVGVILGKCKSNDAKYNMLQFYGDSSTAIRDGDSRTIHNVRNWTIYNRNVNRIGPLALSQISFNPKHLQELVDQWTKLKNEDDIKINFLL